MFHTMAIIQLGIRVHEIIVEMYEKQVGHANNVTL